ncbi:MAG TPA: FtsX-like permease family protein [Flexivirga sp.]|uniref:ABC transporter permease n=1 Tax=Flexivirga sp. TaxID=1962927 RepID=UPI002BFB820A|nr:FtsX-like permease family protein [Flexivirga sp.]HWC24097.1 FtsX-like permease family protein [Flexivirga sp.]
MRRDLVLGSARELGTVGLVAGLSGAYAGALLTCSSMLSAMNRDEGSSVGVFLAIVSTVFIGMALYVAAVVISAGVTTVIAGRLQHIATLRLLGARSTDLRRSVTGSTARICLLGSLIGVVVATLLTDVTRVVLVHQDHLPSDVDYPWFSPGSVIAVLAITGVAAVAGWVGSRRVLQVSPAQALAGTTGARSATGRAGALRVGLATVLLVGGVGLFALAMILGERGVGFAFFIAFLAACVTSTGLLVGARFVLPWLVARLGRLVGFDAASLIAQRNAVADPARTTRSTLGLFIGVALVTTIASGTAALQDSVNSWEGLSAHQREVAHTMLSVASTVTIMVGVVSSLIAAVGFVSTMSLTVIQRRRELGLLRALGFTGAQVRSMITKESIAMSAAATVAGIGIGLCYGSASAQALVGAETPGFVWGLPWLVLVAIVLGAVAVILLASQPPARRAIATPPVTALRVDA